MASQLFKLLEAGLGCDVANRCAEHTEKQTQAETKITGETPEVRSDKRKSREDRQTEKEKREK